MKNFNWNRFCLTLGYDFTMGRRLMVRNMMYMLLAYLFVFFIAHLFNPHFGYADGLLSEAEIAQIRMEHIASMVAGMACVMASVFALVVACGLFAGEQTKQGFILTLMLPASNLEKFLSRWVFMVALTLAGTVVVFPVADLLHLLYCLVFGQPVVSTLPHIVDNLEAVCFPWGYSANGVLMGVAAMARLLTIHAFFLLGATLFRKHSFLLTASSLVILLSVFASTVQWLAHLTTHIVEQDATPTQWPMLGSIAFYLLVICAFCWLAYRLFCRWQVVTHKFTHL